ncbi:MAG: hypothetical protein IJW29_07835 [Clostridia bacterium]|nr:hypothetical protein [Clostridia bacterium]
MKIRRFAAFALILVLCLSLVGCANAIKADEAKAHIKEFLGKVEEGDFTAAAEYLHPDRPADLEAFFAEIEADWGVDFQSGIEIVKYTGFSTALYDSAVDGAAFSLTFTVKVSGKSATMEIELVRNDAGFGIYNLDIDT